MTYYRLDTVEFDDNDTPTYSVDTNTLFITDDDKTGRDYQKIGDFTFETKTQPRLQLNRLDRGVSWSKDDPKVTEDYPQYKNDYLDCTHEYITVRLDRIEIKNDDGSDLETDF